MKQTIQRKRNNLKNILFTSVVGPYGTLSEWSRYKNPMSLLANQVTRGQMYFQVQMFNNTWAFDLFAANINANTAILDFPSVDQLKSVLKATKWDRIGISAIIPNFDALLKTYQVIREVLPTVQIDIGGHIMNDDNVIEEIKQNMLKTCPKETFGTYAGNSPDFKDRNKNVTFVKRDGLDYYDILEGVGLKNKEKLYVPLSIASVQKRVMGINVSSTSSGLIIPELGCPMKCDFCATSHKFDGKFVKFLETAEDIMAVANAHYKEGRSEMFIMSENFSLDTKRALGLLKLMEEQKRPYSFDVFSSANSLISLGVENLVKLGYCFIWIGLEESSGDTYSNKMKDIDMKKLVTDLQAHGIEVLGSTILGFEHQKLEDVDREVDYALSYGCVYNQFMLYTPTPGTVLWERMKAEGKLKKDFPWVETHGQSIPNWNHPHMTDEQLESKLDNAFDKDFERLGPSLYRMIKVHRDGYLKTADWDHELVQMRRKKMKKMFILYIPILQAMYKELKAMNHKVAPDVKELRRSLVKITGLKGRLSNYTLSPYMKLTLRKEKRRFKKNLKLKRKDSPTCVLTHYGDFDHTYPAGVPKPRKAHIVIEIPKNH